MNYHTNIKHQELVALLGSRNLYLRLVYAHIANYTQVKGAWCGSQRDLAAQLELPIGTINNQLTELINKGLVVREMNKYRSAGEQKRSADEQKRSADEQNLEPIIKNNNMEVKENNARALSRTAQPLIPSFEDFLKAFGKGYTETTKNSAEMKWNLCSAAKKVKLVEALNLGKWDKPRPDWCIGDFPEPEPQFLRGDEPQDIVRVLYQGMHKLCSRATQQLFGLTYEGEWNK